MPDSIAKWNGIPIANIAKINGIAVAGIAKLNGITWPSGGGGFVAATGGSVTTSGDYKIHTFLYANQPEDFIVTVGGNVETLIVAGGGGAASGGAGAGGLIEEAVHAVTAQTYPVVVGDGGPGQVVKIGHTGGTVGGDSSFDTITAKGGGPGASGWADADGHPGGSGGGGSSNGAGNSNGGTATPSGQGNDGGGNGNHSGSPYPSGGGGGKDAVGGTATDNNTHGLGGDGHSSSITGTPVIYAKGGDGALEFDTGNGNPGAVNTGNGGDGTGGTYTGGNGAKGIVIIRYKFQ